jgi:hypothetical protein
MLMTGGAPAPTSETVQFFNGAAQIGDPQTITTVPAMNLLPFSQVNTGKGWSTEGSAPSIAPLTVTGPDGSANSATALQFMDNSSTVYYAVPSSTNYAGQTVTFSIYAQSAVTTSLNLTLQDNPNVAADETAPCAVSAGWNRCVITYKFPANAGTGFSVSLSSSSYGVPINVWGPQVETATAPGGYVSTIGVARPAGGSAGFATLTWNEFLAGTHNVTVQYGGDANFVGSTSNQVNFTANKEDPSIVLMDSPAGTSVYGNAVTLTATLGDQDNSDGWVPTGTITFYDGGTVIGTGTLNTSGQASITLSGAASLIAGSHSLTVQYGGDSEFNTATSAAVIHTVTRAESSQVVAVSITSNPNPATYGDAVTVTFHITSSVGILPTGSVTFTDGATSLGTVTIDGSGNGSLFIPLFAAGTHSITATYSGDVNYN